MWGTVKRKLPLKEFGLLELELGIRNAEGKESTPGTALVALPYRDGKPVPYPFVPPSDEELEAAEGTSLNA